jgi:hypothetical protein
MNERIRELINQCTSYSDGSTWTSREEFDKEKFAELLIGECLSILSDAQDRYANPGKYEPVEYYVEMRAKEYAMEDAISSIKYRFGVE